MWRWLLHISVRSIGVLDSLLTNTLSLSDYHRRDVISNGDECLSWIPDLEVAA